MITNESRAAYARGLVEHAAAVTAALEKHSPDVREFMRQTFDLQMYPLTFTDTFAAKLEAFRSPSNEGLALRRLSDALTGGSAGTWDEIFHAAEQIGSGTQASDCEASGRYAQERERRTAFKP